MYVCVCMCMYVCWHVMKLDNNVLCVRMPVYRIGLCIPTVKLVTYLCAYTRRHTQVYNCVHIYLSSTAYIYMQ